MQQIRMRGRGKFNNDDRESFGHSHRTHRDQQTANPQRALRLKSTRRFKSIFSIAADCPV
jgi:hypothetical protein